MFSRCLCLLAAFALAQGRAVNISNTWVLPEEGFPVFYRYFRDRISWYEADAVCQFHHANLVTVDTTAQYDAVRAYLKELDISSAVWVGLIRSNPDGEFTWTDYRGLSSEGYWSAAPDARTAPLCAAANPTADYRWEAQACGGPTVASFICELPVPQWALGNEGCMVRNLPALTVLYLPESASVQLTADCGLAGVRKVQCTGNIKREVLLKNLSCVDDDDDITTTPGVSIRGITWPITTENTETEQDSTDVSTEDIINTSVHEDKTFSSTTKAPVNENLPAAETKPITDSSDKKFHRIYLSKQISLETLSSNNEQRNDIPQIGNDVDELIEEETAKLEDERNMQHKLLHDELARRGNFENIFSQPTDHFVPPLVMAKAKVSDDMTVLSLAEKHAQQLAERRILENRTPKKGLPEATDISKISTPSFTSQTKRIETTTELVIEDEKQETSEDESKKDIKTKYNSPKKYTDKNAYSKGKYPKSFDSKVYKKDFGNSQGDNPQKTQDKNTTLYTDLSINHLNESDESSLELKVTLFEPKKSDNFVKMDVFLKESKNSNETEPVTVSTITERIETTLKSTISPETQASKLNVNDEIIKITVVKEANDENPFTVQVFDVTTKEPVSDVKTTTSKNTETTSAQNSKYFTSSNTALDHTSVKKDMESTTTKNTTTSPLNSKPEIQDHVVESTVATIVTENPTESPDVPNEITTSTIKVTTKNIVHSTNNNLTEAMTVNIENAPVMNNTEVHDGLEFESTEEPIDDLNSPLLSAASEPLHRPPRLRRPQQTNHAKKFNPFRILG